MRESGRAPSERAACGVSHYRHITSRPRSRRCAGPWRKSIRTAHCMDQATQAKFRGGAGPRGDGGNLVETLAVGGRNLHEVRWNAVAGRGPMLGSLVDDGGCRRPSGRSSRGQRLTSQAVPGWGCRSWSISRLVREPDLAMADRGSGGTGAAGVSAFAVDLGQPDGTAPDIPIHYSKRFFKRAAFIMRGRLPSIITIMHTGV